MDDMAPEKHPDTERHGGPGASHENRKQPEKSKPHGEISRDEVKSGNAQTREQNKRMNPANVNQQGDHANVRQNTTDQGNRRSS
jgi:hypothetical protein